MIFKKEKEIIAGQVRPAGHLARRGPYECSALRAGQWPAGQTRSNNEEKKNEVFIRRESQKKMSCSLLVNIASD